MTCLTRSVQGSQTCLRFIVGGELLQEGGVIFKGYKRENGAYGVRRHVLIVSTVSCANGVVSAIARTTPGVVPVTHGHGCGTGPHDTRIALRVLAGLGANPNVSAVVVVGLGCEVLRPNVVAETIGQSGKPVELLLIQDAGSVKTAQRGSEMAMALLQRAREEKRVDAPLESLVVGLECGGSDGLSGVIANPSLGVATDMLVRDGATVVLAETTEMIGTTHILQRRAATPEVAEKIGAMIGRVEGRVRAMGLDPQLAIAPGNMEGGLTCLSEKSLGCIAKGGSSAINEVIDYGLSPTRRGLVLMDTPGYDVESMAGLAAGGAQIIAFTTGRGTPAGFPAVPVIKIVSNSETYARMSDDIDVNAGRIIDEDLSIEDMGQHIHQVIMEVANGRLTKSEINGQDCFGFLKQYPSF